ncbi:MAG TPA: isoprenylcysteine carboxylmethyltransferase family protein [Anaerolineaceae bacterium]
MPPAARGSITRWLARSVLGTVLYAAVLFIPAGTLGWLWGWVLLSILIGLMIAEPAITAARHPDLLAERDLSWRAAGVKAWDRWITTLVGGLMLGQWVTAGLDFRFHWTAPLALPVHLAALAVTLLGHAVFLWAMASNAFFSGTVRIQVERGHAVEDGGPYRFVRHPGYVGVILTQVSTPILLGSLWALVPGLIAVAFFILRTRLEDETLQRELAGYADYTRRTHFRLLPGVW